MANLIITVIAIALVAVASLMGAYYGGSAFLNNTQAANASTFLNVGQQLAGAWTAYLADHNNTPPTQWSDLTSGANPYLASPPTIPAMAGGIPAMAVPVININTDGTAWLWAQVGHASGTNPDENATACNKIIKAATGNNVTTPQTEAYGSTGVGDMTSPGNGNGTFGCILYNNAVTNYKNNLPGNSPLSNLGSYYAYYRLQ